MSGSAPPPPAPHPPGERGAFSLTGGHRCAAAVCSLSPRAGEGLGRGAFHSGGQVSQGLPLAQLHALHTCTPISGLWWLQISIWYTPLTRDSRQNLHVQSKFRIVCLFRFFRFILK
jgi:hypothetical protein